MRRSTCTRRWTLAIALAIASVVLVPFASASGPVPTLSPKAHNTAAGEWPLPHPPHLDTRVVSRISPISRTAESARSGPGFDWSVAGIGAGSTVGLVLVAAGAGLVTRRVRRPVGATD